MSNRSSKAGAKAPASPSAWDTCVQAFAPEHKVARPRIFAPVVFGCWRVQCLHAEVRNPFAWHPEHSGYRECQANASEPSLLAQAIRNKLSEEFVKQLRNAELKCLEDEFAAGDVKSGLLVAQYVLSNNLPVPTRIAAWLAAAIQGYVDDHRSVDAGLGLRASGRANPARQERDRHKRWEAFNRMAKLQAAGATIPQAARLVAALQCYGKYSTLEDRYRRSGFSGDARLQTSVDLEALLAEYPDSDEVLEAKVAIRATYAKAGRVSVHTAKLK